MSHILWLDPITAWYILLTVSIVELKRGNLDPVLIVKRTEWSKFIDYFSLNIWANPSTVGKKNVSFVCIWSIKITPFGNTHK